MPRIPALPRRCAVPGPALFALALALATPSTGAPASASLLGGRVTFGGELSGTIAREDEGYFNYSDYSTSQLRLLRADLSVEGRLASFASLLAELRSDNLSRPRVYALYLRLTPRPGRPFDLQAGLVPPVFGSYPRRPYAYDNPLPSVPLAYQYFTTLRYDALPSRAEDLVQQRGRGWLVHYPIGDTASAPGLPLVDAARWDTGVQARLGGEPWSLSLALTQGSPSRPLVRDDNGGKQVSARLQWKPGPALTLGVSGASAEFVSRKAVGALPPAARGRFPQRAAGLDLEWSKGYWILRGEAVYSRWTLPAVLATPIERPLEALGAYAEARYKLRPGLYAAARVERLGFGEIDSSLGRQSWDAPVTRLEAGAGYVPLRHVLLKVSWQHNWRDGGRVRANDLVAAQALLWF
jgi:hypothetical protein